MRLLLVHNRYQHSGGEDEVFRTEAELLRSAGHEVVEYTRDNRVIDPARGVGSVRLAANAVWARGEAGALEVELARVAPSVVHFHNTFPLISPAAYYACRRADVPVVQTLHNYRLLCPSANMFRAGRVCEQCSQHSLMNGIRHACYRGSRSATAAVAAMLTVHRGLRTWRDQVDVYIALSEFARDKFVGGGLPPQKVVVKPNFVHPDPGPRQGSGETGLFVGRLSAEKGGMMLIDAWKRLAPSPQLDIVGDGPERAGMEAAAAAIRNVNFRGRLTRDETLSAFKRAQFLVFPSGWYEGMPMTILEAFACGVPVIASRLGTMAEIVSDGRTGLHFTAGDPADLARAVAWAFAHPKEMEAMGRAARKEFEAKYTGCRNYDMLMTIYSDAIEAAGRKSSGRVAGLATGSARGSAHRTAQG
jgi:glycosyltransferase involved in cell wall biosynthesis